MDEKSLLKQIAYYGKILEESKKWNKVNHYSPNLRNKYKFVKTNNGSSQPKLSKENSQKKYISPSYKFVNAQRFVKPTHSVSSSNVHSIDKTSSETNRVNQQIVVKSTYKIEKKNVSQPNSSKQANLCLQPSQAKKTTVSNTERSHEKYTRYKIVRNGNTDSSVNRKVSIQRSKYKLVRMNVHQSSGPYLYRKRTVNFKLSATSKPKQMQSKPLKTKYKIVRSSVYKYVNRTLDCKSSSCTKSKNRVKRRVHTRMKCPDKTRFKKSYSLNISGVKYVIDRNQKTLKLAEKETKVNKNIKGIKIDGVLFVRKSPSTLVRAGCETKVIPKSSKLKIITLSSKLRKNNIPCKAFVRFGKCSGKEKGTCHKVHNPNQVAICKKFLQGACTKKDCFLSHKTTSERMPTCKFFLEGCCARDDCPYLHVKLSSKAEICKSFLNGYCEKGNECEKRHEFSNLEFEKSSKQPMIEAKNMEVVKIEKRENTEEVQTNVPEQNKRYFEDSILNESLKNGSDFSLRSKLGELPGFIPLSE